MSRPVQSATWLSVSGFLTRCFRGPGAFKGRAVTGKSLPYFAHLFFYDLYLRHLIVMRGRHSSGTFNLFSQRCGFVFSPT